MTFRSLAVAAAVLLPTLASAGDPLLQECMVKYCDYDSADLAFDGQCDLDRGEAHPLGLPLGICLLAEATGTACDAYLWTVMECDTGLTAVADLVSADTGESLLDRKTTDGDSKTSLTDTKLEPTSTDTTYSYLR